MCDLLAAPPFSVLTFIRAYCLSLYPPLPGPVASLPVIHSPVRWYKVFVCVVTVPLLIFCLCFLSISPYVDPRFWYLRVSPLLKLIKADGPTVVDYSDALTFTLVSEIVHLQDKFSTWLRLWWKSYMVNNSMSLPNNIVVVGFLTGD